MTGLQIYILGVIISYILGRFTIRKLMKEQYSWNDIGKIMFISLCSYLGIAIFFCILLWYYYLTSKFKNNKLPKPPTWL